MKRRSLKDLSKLKLTKSVIVPFPNFQQNTIISPTQINDNFEEIEYAYNNLIDNHNGAIQSLQNALNELITNNDEIVSNEEERIKREEKRIETYNTHVSNETKREEAHSNMIATFDLKIEEVNNLLNSVDGYVPFSVFESRISDLVDKIKALEELINNNNNNNNDNDDNNDNDNDDNDDDDDDDDVVNNNKAIVGTAIVGKSII